MDISLMQRPEKHYLGFTKTAPMKDLMSAFEGTYEQIGAFMQEHGITPTGPGVAIYKEWDMVNGVCTFMPAFEVSADTEAGELELFTVPAGDAYVALYKGSYAQMNVPHGQMMERAKADGKEESLVIEEYLVGPQSGVAEDAYETQLVHVVK